MTKTMRLVLGTLAEGKPCYVMPATRRALIRGGFITMAERVKKSGSSNGYRFIVTAKGLEALGAVGETTVPAGDTRVTGLVPGSVYSSATKSHDATPIGVASSSTTIHVGRPVARPKKKRSA